MFSTNFFFKIVLYSKNKDVKLGRAWLAILHVLKKSIASFPVKYQQKTIRLCKRKNSPYFSFQLHSAITKKKCRNKQKLFYVIRFSTLIYEIISIATKTRKLKMTIFSDTFQNHLLHYYILAGQFQQLQTTKSLSTQGP